MAVLGSLRHRHGNRARSTNVRYRRRRNPCRRRRTPVAAAGAAGAARAGRRSYSADLAASGVAECASVLGRHLRGDRGDLLYRPARRRVARGDGAGVSLRDADHDHVGRRDGRRRGLRDRACARRRRSRARLDPGDARDAERDRLRSRLHVRHADLRAISARGDGRPRQCAGAGGRLCADLLRRRRAAMAVELVRRNLARHRQHEAAVGHVPQCRVVPDRAGRLARPRDRADPAIRHARRRSGHADRLHDQRVRDGLVPVLRPRPRRAEDQGPAHPGRDVLRHLEGRRGRPASRRSSRC